MAEGEGEVMKRPDGVARAVDLGGRLVSATDPFARFITSRSFDRVPLRDSDASIRSDGHLVAEVAHEQDGAHEETRGAKQVLRDGGVGDERGRGGGGSGAGGMGAVRTGVPRRRPRVSSRDGAGCERGAPRCSRGWVRRVPSP